MMHTIKKSDINFLKNTALFINKKRVTNAIISLLEHSRDSIKSEIEKKNICFSKEVDVIHGKISRGENYKGFPYMVLDYPKYFSKESVIAFRTIFWWGNEISFTLHLQGKAFEERKEMILKKISSLTKKHVYICVNENPWEHHFEKENYVLSGRMEVKQIKELIAEKSFIKLSRKLPIEKVNQLPSFCKESFRMFSVLVDLSLLPPRTPVENQD